MRLYKCEWLDGSVSFVLASNKKDAASKLREVGSVDADMVIAVTEFLVTLAPVIPSPEALADDAPWYVSELGDCMADVLPDYVESLKKQRLMQGEETSKEGSCEGCPSHDPVTGTCKNEPGAPGSLEAPFRLASLGEMPIPPEEREGLRLVLENLCLQIVEGKLPAANQLVAVIHANYPGGARGAILHRDVVRAKGGTTMFPAPFVEGALMIPAAKADSLLVLVETSNGIGSFVASTTNVVRAREQTPAFFRAPGSTAVN